MLQTLQLVLIVLTVNFELNDFANAVSNSVAALTQVKPLSVFFNVLKQQRAITEYPCIHSVTQLLIVTRFAACNTNKNKNNILPIDIVLAPRIIMSLSKEDLKAICSVVVGVIRKQ